MKLIMSATDSTRALILLSSNRDGDGEIYIMNMDGIILRQLTNNEFSDYMAAWSPDGQRIAFVSNRDGNMRSMSWCMAIICELPMSG
jgi:TolB protein